MDGDIRPMEKRDVPAVHEIECACFRSPWSKMALYGEFRNDVAHYHVMEQDGKIMAYAGMWVLFEEAHITNIAVLEPYRRQGNCSRLLLSMMESAVLLGASCMTLEVRDGNLTAQRVYERLHFERKGFRPRYYSDTGEGAIIMWNMDIQKTLVENGRKENHGTV